MAAHTNSRAILWKEEDSGAMDSTDRIDSMGEREFQTVYEQTAGPILAYLAGVTGRGDVADDLLQETFCRYLVKQPKGMDANETRRYLFRIATNLLHDRWRGRQETQFPDGYDEGASTNIDLQLDVRQAMRALKSRDRELLWLAYVEGMNHAEIASTTGLSALSIRLLLFRARRKAASLLRPEEETR